MCWLIIKAVKDVIMQIIINFLIKEIFMHYRSSKELLSNNKTNFKVSIVEYYLQKLVTHHYNIIVYYL